MEKEKHKNIKKEFTACLLIGLICIIAAAVCLFVLYRPFVKWEKFVCSEKDGTFIANANNSTIVTYTYEIDGERYEKTLRNINTSLRAGTTRFTIYVNTDNPNDVKRGNLGGWGMLGFILFWAATGVLMIGFGFHQKKRAR
ncbi:MAG: DUF3592 domain-containing protein [Clostridiales bacterium]|jgi:hypothetical protein|nr:DUF3592 domain-containing protein [Clostridiales bacterium]